MSQTLPAPLPSAPPVEARLGVIEAMGLGWNLLTSDFWPLWLAAFMVMLISGFAGPARIVVGPPLAAGLFYVIAWKMRGGKVDLGQVFQGFSQRFKQSFIAGLVPYGAQLAMLVIWLPIHLCVVFGGMGLSGMHHQGGPPEPFIMMPLMLVDMAVAFGLSFGVLVVYMFFIFAQCEVWNSPESGWAAAKFSVRLVWNNLGSVLGLCVLFWLVYVAAGLLGMIGCCVGQLFTIPVAQLWFAATVLYLDRSWTGRPIDWAPAAGSAAPPTA